MIGHLWTLVELPFKGHGGSHWKMTPLNCSFPCKWEVVIVSWTLQGHLSSLGAINNHYYTVQTPYTQAWTQTTCKLIQGCTKQFGWISPLHHETGSVIYPFRAPLHFVGCVSIHVFKQPLCAVHTYVLIHSSTLARPQKVLFQLGLKCAYLPFSQPISSLSFSLSFLFFAG